MRGHASVPRKSPDSFTFLVCYQVTGLHIREHLVSSRTHAIPNFSENDWQFCNYGSMNFYFPPLPRLDSSWADSWVLRPFNLKTFAFGMCYKIEMVSQESTCILEHVSPPCVNCFIFNNLAPINRAKITKACCQLSNSQDRHTSKKVFLSNWKTEVPYLIPEQDPSTNK